MAKFGNRYRIESNRMPGWDYAGNGYYFITLVIQNRECLLGKIKNGEVTLSDFGKIAKEELHKSFEIRQELFLDEFVMMPNHLHAIVIIDKSKVTNMLIETDVLHVETHGRASLRVEQSNQLLQNDLQTGFCRKPKSLSSFIAGYKSSVTTKVDDFIDLYDLSIVKYNRRNKFWQANYNDHVIRNEKEYWEIKNYIKNNPANWVEDKFYK